MKDDDPRRMTPVQLRDAILTTHGSDQAELIRAAAASPEFPMSWIPRHLLCSRRTGDYTSNGNQE